MTDVSFSELHIKMEGRVLNMVNCNLRFKNRVISIGDSAKTFGSTESILCSLKSSEYQLSIEHKRLSVVPKVFILSSIEIKKILKSQIAVNHV